MDILKYSEQILNKEIKALKKVSAALDENFEKIVRMIHECRGKVVVTGMGKSGHIGKKISATMSSIGIPSIFLHPAEAVHGDLGSVNKNDLVLAFSFSGETDEVLSVIPALRKMRVKIISIVGMPNSTLEKFSEVCFIIPKIQEVFLDDMVPTSSTTVMLALGDAIAVTVSSLRGFTKNDFAVFHPHGTLGKKLTTTVKMMMRSGENNATVTDNATLEEAILEMCQKGLSGVCIVNNKNQLLGVFTDGDLRRISSQISKTISLDSRIFDFMTKTPVMVEPDMLVYDVMKELNKKVSFLPVIQNGKLCGTLLISDIVDKGLS
ncbi:MAG: KpsF/GutQ family sugar-phosphate isomerase [Lachnospiraceae bacterium]